MRGGRLEKVTGEGRFGEADPFFSATDELKGSRWENDHDARMMLLESKNLDQYQAIESYVDQQRRDRADQAQMGFWGNHAVLCCASHNQPHYTGDRPDGRVRRSGSEKSAGVHGEGGCDRLGGGAVYEAGLQAVSPMRSEEDAYAGAIASGLFGAVFGGVLSRALSGKRAVDIATTSSNAMRQTYEDANAAEAQAILTHTDGRMDLTRTFPG